VEGMEKGWGPGKTTVCESRNKGEPRTFWKVLMQRPGNSSKRLYCLWLRVVASEGAVLTTAGGLLCLLEGASKG